MSSGLTERQEECLRLTRRMTDKQIAAHLGVSEATVKKHVLEACRRLGVNRRKAGLALLEEADGSTAAPSVLVASEPHIVEASGIDDDVAGPQAGPIGESQGAVPAFRLGYRPPPAGGLARVAMIGLATVIGALVLGAVTDLVAGYHYRVGAIDDATRPGLADRVTRSDDAA